MEQLGELLKPLLEAFGGKVGPLVQLLAMMGSARLLLKPFQLLEKPLFDFIKSTETKKDDELLAKAESSKAWKVVKFLVDYLFSLKLK